MNSFVFFAYILSLLCSLAVILMYRNYLSVIKRFESRIDDVESRINENISRIYEIENYRHMNDI